MFSKSPLCLDIQITSYHTKYVKGYVIYLLSEIILCLPTRNTQNNSPKKALKIQSVFHSLQDVSQIQLGLSRPNEKRHSDLLNAMSARLSDAIYRDFLRKERRKMLLS